jgi:pimeloyl-ACP methyl ester carboxylesterase
MQTASLHSSPRPRTHSKKILFIHSLHFNSHCWEKWVLYYRSIGYVCYAPNWPYHEMDAGLGRICNADPRPLTLAEIVDLYIFIIQEAIEEPPIIIGHGTGSLIAQILASFGLAIHCVCLAARPANIFPDYQRHWSFFPYLALRKHSVKIPSLPTFRRYYANTSTIPLAGAVIPGHGFGTKKLDSRKGAGQAVGHPKKQQSRRADN